MYYGLAAQAESHSASVWSKSGVTYEVIFGEVSSFRLFDARLSQRCVLKPSNTDARQGYGAKPDAASDRYRVYQAKHCKADTQRQGDVRNVTAPAQCQPSDSPSNRESCQVR